MNKNILIFSGIFLFLIGFVFVYGQPVQPTTSSNGQAQSCMMCTIAGAILDELKIFNDHKPGEMVTGYAVLKDGTPSTREFWVPLPVGTCDVTVVSQSQVQHTVNSMEARDVSNTRNSQSCSSQNPGGSVWIAQCTHTMTFDQDFHFYHSSLSLDTHYFSVAYKCILS